MRYVLTVDFEEEADIEAFLKFVKYHAKRLKATGHKDVFILLAREWEKQQETPVLDLSKVPKPLKPAKKRTTRQPYKDDEDSGLEMP